MRSFSISVEYFISAYEMDGSLYSLYSWMPHCDIIWKSIGCISVHHRGIFVIFI